MLFVPITYAPFPARLRQESWSVTANCFSLPKTLEKRGRLWEFPNMNAVKVDAAKRIRLPVLRPGDYYEPECLGPEEIMLRRVPEPKRKLQMTKAQALAAIERSRLRFTVSWAELRLETRE
jgi:hypothetical protein